MRYPKLAVLSATILTVAALSAPTLGQNHPPGSAPTWLPDLRAPNSDELGLVRACVDRHLPSNGVLDATYIAGSGLGGMKCRVVYNLETGAAWRVHGGKIWLRTPDGARYEGHTDIEGLTRTGPDKEYIKGDMSIEFKLVPLIALRLALTNDAIRGVNRRADGFLECYMAYAVDEQQPVAYGRFDKTWYNGPVRLLRCVFDKDQRLVQRVTVSDAREPQEDFTYSFAVTNAPSAQVAIPDVVDGWKLIGLNRRVADASDFVPAAVWRTAVLSRTEAPSPRIDLRQQAKPSAVASQDQTDLIAAKTDDRHAAENERSQPNRARQDGRESLTGDDLSASGVDSRTSRLRGPLIATGVALIALGALAWWRRR